MRQNMTLNVTKYALKICCKNKNIKKKNRNVLLIIYKYL